jgi:hypothetical protein
MRNFFIPILSLALIVVTSCDDTKYKNGNNELDITVETYVLNTPPLIGDYEGVTFFEGGFSGIYYIPDSNNEYYLINDRGPNIPASNHPQAGNREIKLFPFPYYSQKLTRVKLENGQVRILDIKPISVEAKTPLLGLPILSADTLYQEYAWIDYSGNEVPHTKHGADIEGLVFENDSIFWFVEEYRPSMWKINLNSMHKIEEYSPNNGRLPTVLLKRQPNRGFEGVAFHDHVIYGMLQSPLWNPTKQSENASRLSRIVALDTKTDKTSMYIYEMNESKGEVRIKDWKIGDITATSDGKLLVLEHGSRGADFFADVFLVDLHKGSVATDAIDSMYHIESFLNKEELFTKTGLHVVGKKHIVDLKALGIRADLGKIEGITLVNDSTIAIVNDNDYGIDPINDSGKFIENNSKTTIILIKNINLK